MWVTQRGPQAAHQGGQRGPCSVLILGVGEDPSLQPGPDQTSCPPPHPRWHPPKDRGGSWRLGTQHPIPSHPDRIQAPSPQPQPQEHLIISWVARTLKGAECPLTSQVRREVGTGGQKQVGEASHNGTGQRS